MLSNYTSCLLASGDISTKVIFSSNQKYGSLLDSLQSCTDIVLNNNLEQFNCIAFGSYFQPESSIVSSP